MGQTIFKRYSRFAWLIPTGVALAIYFTTACRTVWVGDSGEFALVFKTLGVAHPPGYPLFTLLGHLFVTLFGFLRPAFAANLFALLVAGACLPLLFIAIGGREKPIIAAMMILLWAFSPSFWSESTAVEVYGFHLALIALLIALSFSTLRPRWYLISYVLGLAFAHHLSILAVLPSLLLVFLIEKTKDRWRPWPLYLLLFWAGLSIYFFLPARASVSPVADWGHPVTWSALWAHVSGAQYHYAASFSLSQAGESFALLGALLLRNWSWIGLAAILAGIVLGFREDRLKIGVALLLMISTALLNSFYRIPDIDAYYLPALLGGWLLLSGTIISSWNRLRRNSARVSLLLLLGISVIALLTGNYGRITLHGNRLAEEYGKAILESAPAGVIFTQDDNASATTLYLRYAEGYRPQLEIYDQSSRLSRLCDAASVLAARPITTYREAREIFLQKSKADKYLAKCHFPYRADWYDVNAPLYSQGLLYGLKPATQKASIPDLQEVQGRDDFKPKQMLINLALCQGEEWQLGRTAADSAHASRYFHSALELLRDEPRGALWNQLGIAYRHFGQEELALTSYAQALKARRLSKSERAEVFFNFSNIYKDRGNRLAAAEAYQGAVQAFEKALEYDPENAKVLYNVGVLYIQYLQIPQKGTPYLEKYLRINADDESARALLKVQQH